MYNVDHYYLSIIILYLSQYWFSGRLKKVVFDLTGVDASSPGSHVATDGAAMSAEAPKENLDAAITDDLELVE